MITSSYKSPELGFITLILYVRKLRLEKTPGHLVRVGIQKPLSLLKGFLHIIHLILLPLIQVASFYSRYS